MEIVITCRQKGYDEFTASRANPWYSDMKREDDHGQPQKTLSIDMAAIALNKNSCGKTG